MTNTGSRLINTGLFQSINFPYNNDITLHLYLSYYVQKLHLQVQMGWTVDHQLFQLPIFINIGSHDIRTRLFCQSSRTRKQLNETHEDKDSMETQKLLSSVIEDTKTRIPSLGSQVTDRAMVHKPPCLSVRPSVRLPVCLSVLLMNLRSSMSILS